MDPLGRDGALQRWREWMAASQELEPWWMRHEDQLFSTDGSQEVIKEEQLVTKDIDEHEVNDAKDI